MLNMIKGCRIHDPSILFEGYQQTDNGFIANVNAEKIQAILESFIPDAESYTNEQIKHIIRIAFGNLPGGLQGIHFPESLRDNY